MEPVVGGEPTSAFLRRRLSVLVPAVLDQLVAEIPVYARLPRELIEGDVRAVVQRAVVTFADALTNGGAIADAALAELSESAVRRAEEGVPMEMVLAAYFHGSAVCLQDLESLATPPDLTDVLGVTQALVRFLQEVTRSVAAGYSAHNRSVITDQANTQQMLINALLDGTDVELAASRCGARLPTHYLVLSLVTGTHPDEADPQVDKNVANQRKLRRLHEEMERHYPALLWMPTTDGGLALIEADETSERRLTTALRALQLATGVAVHIGLVTARPDEVGLAARTARDVADVARRLDRESGVFRLRDVALEYQLTRATPARELIAELLNPLRGQPELVHTLRTYLDSGHSRRETAAMLQVHPNTVDNRLRRIATLTGLDPLRASDLPAITAALAASAGSAPIRADRGPSY